jgi:WD40 repeat protein
MSRRIQLAAILACALVCVGVQGRGLPEEFKLHTPSPAESVLIAKNGVVAAVCKDHKLRVWSLPDARLLRTFDLGGRKTAALAISDDGRWLLYGDYDGVVTVWDGATGQVGFEQRFDRYLLAAVFSHDSRLLAIAPGGRSVRIIDVSANRPLSDLDYTPTVTNGLAFSHDAELIGFGERDGLRVYSVRTGKLVSQNTDFLSEPLAMDFTRDGKEAVAAGGDKVVVFSQTPTGKTLRRTERTAEVPIYLEVSPDGSQLAAVTLKADNLELPAPVIVWEIASLQQKINWVPPSGVLGATWTREGHFLVATSTPEAVHLWRLN